jgi:hypothetical protein
MTAVTAARKSIVSEYLVLIWGCPRARRVLPSDKEACDILTFWRSKFGLMQAVSARLNVDLRKQIFQPFSHQLNQISYPKNFLKINNMKFSDSVTKTTIVL